MYGAIPKGSLIGISPVILEKDAGGTFAVGDFVKFSSGEYVVGTAAAAVAGVAMEAATSASSGVAANITPYLMVLMDNDNDTTTFAATHPGTYFDFIGATGAMLVDTNTTSATTGCLLCLEYNPQGVGLDSDTSIGKYVVIESLFNTLA